MKRRLLATLAFAVVAASLVSTGAFVDSPDGTDQIEMVPSEDPNSAYAVNNSGEIKLDLSETNQKLSEDAEGINEDAVTVVENIFVLRHTGTEGVDSPARVWFEIAQDDIEFVRGTGSVSTIDGENNSAILAPGEQFHIGLVVDTTGDHDVENAEEFTLRAEPLEDDGSNTADDEVQTEPADGGNEESAGDGTSEPGTAPGDGTEDQSPTGAADGTDDQTTGDQTGNEEQTTADDADGGDQTAEGQTGDQTGDDGQTGDQAGTEDQTGTDDQTGTGEQTGETANGGTEGGETDDATDGGTSVDDAEDGSGLVTPGTTPDSLFPGPEATLGGFILWTFLLLVASVLLGATVFGATRYGVTSLGGDN